MDSIHKTIAGIMTGYISYSIFNVEGVLNRERLDDKTWYLRLLGSKFLQQGVGGQERYYTAIVAGCFQDCCHGKFAAARKIYVNRHV